MGVLRLCGELYILAKVCNSPEVMDSEFFPAPSVIYEDERVKVLDFDRMNDLHPQYRIFKRFHILYALFS